MDSPKVRELNDAFRTTLIGGRVMLTEGVAELSQQNQAALLKAVVSFAEFNPDNDPHGEHDFGSLKIAEQTFFWKIDCYNKSLGSGSPDPADPAVTTRVLTIMRADEY